MNPLHALTETPKTKPKQRWSSASRKNFAYTSKSGHLFIFIGGSCWMFQPRRIMKKGKRK